MKIIINNYKVRPKQRPRIGRGKKIYSPSGGEEKLLAWEIKAYVSHAYPKHKIITDKVKVDLLISSEKDTRGDIDNYEKFIYDSLQKSGVIQNDKQIRENHTRIEEGESKLIITISEYKQ